MNTICSYGVLKRFVTTNSCKLWITTCRTILSEAYLCEEFWKKRLDNPIINSIKSDQYFIETDKKFGTKQLVSGVDLDLFANCLDDESQLDELEHLLYKFRRTKRATEIMNSTIYAVVRVYLKFRQYESLFRILNDRENYGIFPDLYSYNILMSTFLKEKMYKEAANVAALMMLQENFENKISCVLGLHSCEKFLNEGSLNEFSLVGEEEEVKSKEENEDDEEETLVRVPFLRNPWFDDHFEITNPKHLLGKTLYLIGREVKNPLGYSYQLVGLAMYEKWEKALNLLKSFLETKDCLLLTDTIERIKLHLKEIPDDDKNSKESWIKQFNVLFEDIKSKGKLETKTLATALADELEKIPHLEKEDIASQQKLFLEWEKQRKSALDRQNTELDKERRLKAIEEKKEYLHWKEKLLFFFENEEKNLKELKQVEELVESIKKKEADKDTYIPPEIMKKAPITVTKYQRLARVKKI